jgi:2-desacetyl-2-hydroxyethyl bacteriochlorophyllide A dehydrogenase
MKAAVVRANQQFTIEDLPMPVVEPGGVVMKVKACGVCGSDLHSYRRGGREGIVKGHEFAGDIIEIGAGVKGVKKGDRVAVMTGRGCGECYWCKQGEIVKCVKLSMVGIGFNGGFAEYVSVPNFRLGQYAAKLPDNMSYEIGATAEPLSVSLYAAQRIQAKAGDVAVVIGLGVIGLGIIPVLKSMGVKQIIASGRRPSRLKLAKDSGATVVVDTDKENVAPLVKEMTGGRGGDIVFECAGAEVTFQQALGSVRKGGKVEIVGIYEVPFTWNPTALVGADIDLVGCGLRWDIPGAMELMRTGKVDMQPYITHTFSLDETKKAFDAALKDPDAVKVMVKP